MKSIPSLRQGLLRRHLDDELLVYDARTDEVHLLNSSTAKVVDQIGKGGDWSEVAAELGEESGADAGAEILALALDDLARARLLDHEAAVEAELPAETRRQMIQKLAGLSAALLIPAVLTLAPRTAYAQASPLANGLACDLSSQCQSGCCQQSTSGACQNKTCVASTATCANCR